MMVISPLGSTSFVLEGIVPYYLVIHELAGERIKLFDEFMEALSPKPGPWRLMTNAWLVLYGGQASHVSSMLLSNFKWQPKERFLISEITPNYFPNLGDDKDQLIGRYVEPLSSP